MRDMENITVQIEASSRGEQNSELTDSNTASISKKSKAGFTSLLVSSLQMVNFERG
jgi:hypothetical protein